ncbi:MAG: IS1634 family transposase [Candidatus Symbiopectobacterium sp. Clec_Harlan]|nr:IS1634 family transposase [Candidatus Symbiopectobacterium sp. Clec_Harlan]
MSTPHVTIRNLDHLGLVAALCDELSIAKMIDAVLPKKHQAKVSHGQAMIAMILNGLGFHSGTLHMFPQFFANKPVERLIGPGICEDDLNDDVLGRCLDALFDADVSALYQVIAEKVVATLGLKSTAVHLDITSFHVDGAYSFSHDEGTKRLQLVRGYSRDHRPDLNQVVLELVCENQAGLPVYMQAKSGNSNDNRAFSEMVRHHLLSLKAAQESRYMVGDAAMYNAETIYLLHQQQQLFVTRVPLTLKEAKKASANIGAELLSPMSEGYHGRWQAADYGGIPQRWLLVRSEQASQREQKTLFKKLLKESTRELKAFAKLCAQHFACQTDAENALQHFVSGLKTLRIDHGHCHREPVYDNPGRPKTGQKPDGHKFRIEEHAFTCLEKVEEAYAQTGVFILATNDLSETLTMDELLATYKAQQKVERGFRFLKSPDFLTSSLYLKKPERIEALLMVMTCSLMIYSALEYRIRNALAVQGRSVPDMKKKPTQKPTARWVFLCFFGIYEFSIGDRPPQVSNLNSVHKTIVDVLGERYRRIYS